MANDYPFITHTECAYFPCHKGLEPENFNCLFCFCPLYMLGPDCGGNFTYSESGVKVCTDCTITHERNRGNELVNEKWPLIKAKAVQPKND